MQEMRQWSDPITAAWMVQAVSGLAGDTCGIRQEIAKKVIAYKTVREALVVKKVFVNGL